MTAVAEAAVHCEAKKHAYRQTQDGVVVSFVLHPQEVPDGLATASLGTRYMLALVEIGDDEQPVAKRYSYAQRAGIMCGEGAFSRFLSERYLKVALEASVIEDADGKANGDGPAIALRKLCGVKSRKHLLEGTPAGERYLEIEREYAGWLRHG